jgi:hypothetical protein
MTNEQYIDWNGASGQSYRYWFLSDPSVTGIKASAGNYAFVKQLPNGNFTPLYFGETGDLQTRIPNHDRWEDARRAGMTHVMAHTASSDEASRMAEEKDLVQKWHTSLNTEHRLKMS